MVNEALIRDLEFSHFVVIPNERAIFGYAEENGNIHRFLIGTDGNWVKRHQNNQWQELAAENAARVKSRAEDYYGRVPTIRARWEF